MVAAAALVAGAAVLGGAVISSRASKDAAKTQSDSSLLAAQIQADSATEAIQAQKEAAARAQEFFTPFAGVAERGIGLSSFLGNPQEQFDFLQSNPLFQASLDNANRITNQSAAASGRLNAGDTLTNLSQNVLLSAQPLIDRQRQDIAGLLNLGTGLAGSQANIETGLGAGTSGLLTDSASAQSAGIIGSANAQSAGMIDQAKIINDSLLAGAAIFANR